MTLKEELYVLFNEDKSIEDCLKLNYKRASVYRIHKEFRSDKEKEKLKALTDESEQIKKVFSAFQGGWKLRKIITKYGISPQKVIDLHIQYIKLAEIEAGYKENLDRINDLMNQKDNLEAEIKGLKPNLNKIIDKFNEVNNRWNKLSLFNYLQYREQYLQIIIDVPIFPDGDYSKENMELKNIRKIRDILPCPGSIGS